jgi:hypothetical protein
LGAGVAGAGAASGDGEAAGAGVAEGSFSTVGALWASAAPAARLVAKAIVKTIAITPKHFISNTPVNVLRTGRIGIVVGAIHRFGAGGSALFTTEIRQS